jgi:hypothetical protein
MYIKASGRSALIMATGLLLCLTGPMRTTESVAGTADAATKTESAASAAVVTKHTRKQAASHKSAKVAKAAKDTDSSKSADDKKSDDATAATNDTTPAGIPPSVANARAQVPGGDTAADNAVKNMSAQADSVLKSAQQGQQPADVASATAEPVSADQLNDVDRQLSDETPTPTPTLAMAMTTSPSNASNSDSAWGQTSLIGKVFLAFGGLLTLASAARMFMA